MYCSRLCGVEGWGEINRGRGAWDLSGGGARRCALCVCPPARSHAWGAAAHEHTVAMSLFSLVPRYPRHPLAD